MKTWTEKTGGKSVKYIVDSQAKNTSAKIGLCLDGMVNLYKKVAAG